MPVGVNVKRIALWLLMTVMLAGFGSETSADPFSTVADRNDPERHAINSGIEIERSRDWLKAIEFYEQAVDNFPANSELKYGLRRADGSTPASASS